MRIAAVAGSEAAARKAEITGQCGQTRNRSAGEPAIGPFVKRAATDDYHAGACGRIVAGERHDALGLNPGDVSRPIRGIRLHMLHQVFKAHGVLSHKLPVVEVVANHHVHHGQGQRGIRAGPHDEHLIRALRCFRMAHVNGHDAGAAPFGRDHMTRRVGLTGEISPPQHNLLGVLAHVLLGVGLQRAGNTQAKSAKPPADDGPAPGLTPVQIGKALEIVPANARAIVGTGHAVSGPQPHAFASNCLHAARHMVQHLLPTRLAPGIFSAAVANQRM